MIRSHKILLYPNNKQTTYLTKACGVARFAYNWALSEWKRRHEAGETVRESILWRELNTIKREQYPWMLEVAKCVPQLAVKSDLKNAAGDYLEGRAQFPKFRKKGVRDSFTLSTSNFLTIEKKVWISLLGWVNMAEGLRFDGENIDAVISRDADKWYIVIRVAMPDPEPMHTGENQAVGICFGSSSFATLSDGTAIGEANAGTQADRRLKRLNRELSRRKGAKKGETKSGNFLKTKRKISRLYTKTVNIRENQTHRQTTKLTREYGVIGIENTDGMENTDKTGIIGNIDTRGGISYNGAARGIAGIHEFRQKLEYKAVATGTRIIVANRWSPSSKNCHACGYGNKVAQQPERDWICAECGVHNEREINAAIKLRDYAIVINSEQETP